MSHTGHFCRYPYVGVTGIMERQEGEELLKLLPQLTGTTMGDFRTLRNRLMLGYLVSQKTLNGGTNKWAGRYPHVGDIGCLVVDDQRVLNLVHYNGANEGLFTQLMKVHEVAGMPKRLDGFQLNLAWPEPEEVEKYIRWIGSQDHYVVLQIGVEAMDMASNDPATLVKFLRDYQGLVDYCLLDGSGGYGVPLSYDALRPFLDAIYSAELDRYIAIGVAGGLGPDLLDEVTKLKAEFPFLSFDAEGKLQKPEDGLDLETAKLYVSQSLPLFHDLAD